MEQLISNIIDLILILPITRDVDEGMSYGSLLITYTYGDNERLMLYSYQGSNEWTKFDATGGQGSQIESISETDEMKNQMDIVNITGLDLQYGFQDPLPIYQEITENRGRKRKTTQFLFYTPRKQQRNTFYFF